MAREPIQPVLIQRRRRHRSRAWALPLLVAAGAVAFRVVPGALAAPSTPGQVDKITPSIALTRIAICAQDTFNSEAADLTVERDRVASQCHAAYDQPPVGTSRNVTLNLVKADDLSWTTCDYGVADDGYSTTRPLDGRCAAKFTVNELGTHFQFAIWKGERKSKETAIEYTFMPMVDTINGFSVLTQAGKDNWTTSPWIECTPARDACKSIETPAEPGVDRPPANA
jgi:hypothetical protein